MHAILMQPTLISNKDASEHSNKADIIIYATKAAPPNIDLTMLSRSEYCMQKLRIGKMLSRVKLASLRLSCSCHFFYWHLISFYSQLNLLSSS